MSELAQWPALVLTAGLATRLRPLSDVRAKAAMPVAGTTIIGRILEWLQRAGVQRAVLNLHHRPETIAAAVGDGSQFGIGVRYSWEREVLGSAGGPRHALPLLDADRFLIVNGDTLTNCNLAALVEQHLASLARVTMAVVPGDVERYGGVLVGAEGRVRGFGKARDHLRALHFIGVQAVNADVFSDLPDDQPSETVRTLYPAIIARDEDAIVAHESDAEFLDVGTARDYLRTVATVAARERKPFDVGTGTVSAPDARIESSILWDRVTVGSGAQLINCIVADDVVVPAGSRFDHSVVVASPNGLSTVSFAER